LSAPDVCPAYNFYFFDARRMEQEGAFYADAVGGDAPHGEVGVHSPLAQANDRTLKDLYSFAIALDNTRVYFDSIAWVQFGNIWIGFYLTFQGFDQVH